VSTALDAISTTLPKSPVSVGVSLTHVVLEAGEERVGLTLEDAVTLARMLLDAARQLQEADQVTGRRQ
jgi:hypothetical protein